MPEYITKVNVSGVTYALPSPSTVTWAAGTSAGPTGTLTMNTGDTVQIAGIPAAGTSASGVVTTVAQQFAGAKTFNGAVTASNKLVGGYTTVVNTTTSVQSHNISNAVPTAAGVDNQIMFVLTD